MFVNYDYLMILMGTYFVPSSRVLVRFAQFDIHNAKLRKYARAGATGIAPLPQGRGKTLEINSTSSSNYIVYVACLFKGRGSLLKLTLI